jgi:hypothetical protein
LKDGGYFLLMIPRAAFLSVLLATGVSLAAQDFPTIDHRKANIEGKQAMLDFAVETPDGDLTGCRVVLAPGNALERRLYYPCGQWYVPPRAETYLSWMETTSAVSGQQTALIFRAAEYQGAGLVKGSILVPAGSVLVKNTVPEGATVRYMHLDRPGRGFQLRVAAPDAGKAALVPAGRLFAGIFDAEGNAIVHARPVTVEPGKLTQLEILPPSAGGDLLVILEKPSSPRKTEMTLTAGDRAPDVIRDERTRVVAVWYGLPVGEVEVSASPLQFKKTVAVRLGSVVTIRESIGGQ